MSNSKWRDLLNITELEYIAENYSIEIIPNFHSNYINLVSGTYGPFKPNKIIKIPLWLAVKYKNNKKCNIVIPSTYSNSYLQSVLQKEKENTTALFDLPQNFFEISNILFNNAEDDFEDVKKTRNYVADIRAIRTNKINNMLNQISNEDLYLKLNGLNSIEIEQIRPLLKNIFPIRLSILQNNNQVLSVSEALFNNVIKESNNENNEDKEKNENIKNNNDNENDNKNNNSNNNINEDEASSNGFA